MQFFRKNKVEEEIDFEQQRQDQLSQIGLALHQTRQAKNLDLEVVSSQLHIPITVLKSLENANLNKLPEPIFVKHLLRKYANFIHVNNTEINEIINNFYTAKSQVKYQSNSWQLFSIFRRINFNTKKLYIPYIILLLLSIKSLSTLLQSSQFISYNNLNQLDIIETNVNLDNQLKSNQPEVIPAVETKTEAKSSISAELVLKITVEDECWIRVIVDGKQVFMGLLNKGEKREWVAKEKLTIRAGNAGGLSFSLNEGKAEKLGKLGQVEEITFEVPKRS